MTESVPETAPVRVHREGSVLVVTLDRPHVRNAIDRATAECIAAAMDELDGSDELAVGVICGEGKSFCTGMDLGAFLRGERPTVAERGFAGLVESPPRKPLIAAVEGHALAGGFEIVLACDLVVASTSAIFGLPEVKRGLVAAGGGLLRLQNRVPYNVAMEWALTGKFVSADRAHEAGLVNLVVEPGDARAAAMQLAASIAENGPLAVAASKAIITESSDWPRAEAFDRQREITEPVRSSADAREGATAFKEKRAPNWTGR